MTANDIDLATHLAQIHRQALGDQVYVRWEDLNEEAIASSVTAIIAVLAELHHKNLLVPDGGRPLTAEQWAHYQRMAADPRFAELSSDAIGVVKWPANPLLAPAEKPRTHTPPQRNPVTGKTRITVQRACNRCGRNLGDATEKELDASVNGTPLPDVHDECGCDVSPAVPAPNETEWPSLNVVPASVFAVKDRNGFEWRRRSNGTFCGRADCGNGHPDLGPFVADKER
ncbi:hypothetical protein [Rhodococcus qingshengii]|uniref:hypothetical protein n=1 Tax=Rhodococcus qingshengii TaxID=334542 RepID=UPI001C249D1B|nr:hypothetical protein [Rhodococcus qingshengii]QXC40900.1 hypothetical protein KSE96_17310 [Rhodococcus qingshengii]